MWSRQRRIQFRVLLHHVVGFNQLNGSRLTTCRALYSVSKWYMPSRVCVSAYRVCLALDGAMKAYMLCNIIIRQHLWTIGPNVPVCHSLRLSTPTMAVTQVLGDTLSPPNIMLICRSVSACRERRHTARFEPHCKRNTSAS